MGEEHWYKEAIIYELHVKCFYDSSNDGIGDLKGVTEKLDYLQNLGITTIWLLPFYPSPLKDDGYDIADYTDIHPTYGTLRDFKHFLNEAHRRGLRVITELVINHTSDQHPWFQRARHAKKGSPYRNFYVWSDTPEKYKEARIIFQDFETSNWTWDPVAGSYFWHRFYSNQPDLNFENPEVQKAIFRILSFWLKMGVDGLRLDAIPYLYEKEGTICENLPETHAFLKKLRAYIDEHFQDRMLLGEANQWPEEAAKYFGKGDECQMAFHFPVMPRLFMAIQLEDTLPIIEIMGQTPPIPENCQWALFLRNHDELTLEMVTDEERDYMFRVYANDPTSRLNLGIRRRLAPLLRNDRKKIELMNGLLFSLTGTPVIYYGDEIGMGDNVHLGDRNGVRTPMQWSNDRNAGFSRANPQQLYLPPIIDPEYHYETVNVEAQLNNPYSLLWWTKQLVALRKRFKALSYGTTHFLLHSNRKVLVFFREYGDELLMIVVNLSRFAQYVELDLSRYQGASLIELFSSQHFPKIGGLPYFLTLGPYGYYWFAVEREAKIGWLELREQEREKKFDEITVKSGGERLFTSHFQRGLENVVKRYLFRKRWFKPYLPLIDRTKMRITNKITLGLTHLIVVEILLRTGITKKIPLFLKYLKGEEASAKLREFPENVLIKFNDLSRPNEVNLIYDMTIDQKTADLLVDMIENRKKVRTQEGEIKGVGSTVPHESSSLFAMEAQPISIHRESEAVLFPSKNATLKLFYILDSTMNLDIEVRLFLLKKTSFRAFLPLKGYIEYKFEKEPAVALAAEMVAHHPEFDAKKLATQAAERFLLAMETTKEKFPMEILFPKLSWVELAKKEPDPLLRQHLGEYFETAKHLGQTTGEFHKALVSQPADPDFASVRYSTFYQRSLYQTLRNKLSEVFVHLKTNQIPELEKPIQELLSKEPFILNKLQSLINQHIEANRIRVHGRYVLENLQYTGKEFLIADFAGNLNVPIDERRYRRSPLFDCASMLFSISEAAVIAETIMHERGLVKEGMREEVKLWTTAWSLWIGSSFLSTYLNTMKGSGILSENENDIDFLLLIGLIEKSADRFLEGNEAFSILSLLNLMAMYENFKHP